MAPRGDLSWYPNQAFAWLDAQRRGWMARTCWRAGREKTRGHVWSVGAAFPWSLTADKALALMGRFFGTGYGGVLHLQETFSDVVKTDKTGLSKTAHTRWMISAFANFLPGSTIFRLA